MAPKFIGLTSRENVISWLGYLETEFPVDQWIISGFHVWPLIRKQLYLASVTRIDNIRQNPGHSTYNRGMQFLRILSGLMKLLSLKNVDILFSGTHSHRIFHHQAFYNRYFDPMMDYLEKNNVASLYVEYSRSAHSRSTYYKRDRVLYLDDYLPLFRFLAKWFPPKTRVFLPDYEAFLEVIRSAGFLSSDVLKLSPGSLASVVRNLLAYSSFFQFIFKKVKPRACFGLCYYNNQMLAMNHAANLYGITPVDMQHGTQGPLHFAYSNWQKVPSEGYNCLPKVFWCWDKNSAHTVEAWSKHVKGVSVIVGGNPWLDVDHNISGVSLPENIVLYTLQPVGALVEDYLLQVIKETCSDYSWWLRLHPRQLNEYDTLMQLLKEHNLDDYVNVGEATSLPLPYILKHTKLHISKFSGAIQESIMMGIPTLITHEIGAKSYIRDIESGFAQPCLTTDPYEIIDRIRGAKMELKIRESSVTFEHHLKDLLNYIQ